jgi:hypothetical protein
MDMTDEDVTEHLAMSEHTRRWACKWQVPAIRHLVEYLEKVLDHVPEGYTGRYVMDLTYRDGKIVRFQAKDSPVEEVNHEHTV